MPLPAPSNADGAPVSPRPLRPQQQQPSSAATTVLYLSRTGKGMSRRVAGEAALLKAVQERLAPGARLQTFAHGSPQADAAQFRAAKVVLGPHGGAFANLVFMAPGAHVVEFIPLKRLLRSGKNPRPCYFYLAHACRLSYWAVEPDGFDFDDPRLEMRVPVGQVLRALGHIGVLRADAARPVEEAAEEEGAGGGRGPQSAAVGMAAAAAQGVEAGARGRDAAEGSAAGPGCADGAEEQDDGCAGRGPRRGVESSRAAPQDCLVEGSMA